jgi:acetoin utilization deacetylase AcuC-like enzyme
MIIYNKALNLDLESYGIEVPLLDDRSIKCFKKLTKVNNSIKETPLINIQKLTKEDLLLAHNRSYVERLYSSKCDLEIINCYELKNAQGENQRYSPTKETTPLENLFETILLQAGATYAAILESAKSGFCFALSGGMHHAMSSVPRGFCLINDIVIGARKYQKIHSEIKFCVVDIDAHKGCGTAEITSEDTSIETLSIHMKKGWPLDEASGDGPWKIPSSIDIAIDQSEQDQYLDKLSAGLLRLSDCDMAIVVAGADPYELDVLESAKLLKLSKEEMFKRDRLVYEYFKKKNIPQVWLMAGGYGPMTWEIYYQFLKSIHEEESS